MPTCRRMACIFLGSLPTSARTCARASWTRSVSVAPGAPGVDLVHVLDGQGGRPVCVAVEEGLGALYCLYPDERLRRLQGGRQCDLEELAAMLSRALRCGDPAVPPRRDRTKKTVMRPFFSLSASWSCKRSASRAFLSVVLRSDGVTVSAHGSTWATVPPSRDSRRSFALLGKIVVLRVVGDRPPDHLSKVGLLPLPPAQLHLGGLGGVRFCRDRRRSGG